MKDFFALRAEPFMYRCEKCGYWTRSASPDLEVCSARFGGDFGTVPPLPCGGELDYPMIYFHDAGVLLEKFS